MQREKAVPSRSWPRRLTYWLTCLLVQATGIILFRLRRLGEQHYPDTGGALVCSNHQSVLDPLLIGGCCPRRMNFLARESLFRGAFGGLIAWFDAIPLQREGLGIGGIKESLRRLRRGEFLLIFPEGTRSASGELQPLEPGFIALARRGGVPIVPLAIDGAFRAWPRTAKWPRRHPVCIVVGPLISAEEIASRSDESLIAEVAARIRDCWQQARRHTAAV